MALSEREQQVLRDLEAQLHADAPDLVDSMETTTAEPQADRFSPRHVGAGAALVMVGLCLVIAAVMVNHGVVSILIGVAGFALAVCGVTHMLTRLSPGGPPPEGGRGGGSKRRGRPGSATRSTFMERQAERWDRRRDEGH